MPSHATPLCTTRTISSRPTHGIGFLKGRAGQGRAGPSGQAMRAGKQVSEILLCILFILFLFIYSSMDLLISYLVFFPFFFFMPSCGSFFSPNLADHGTAYPASTSTSTSPARGMGPNGHPADLELPSFPFLFASPSPFDSDPVDAASHCALAFSAERNHPRPRSLAHHPPRLAGPSTIHPPAVQLDMPVPWQQSARTGLPVTLTRDPWPMNSDP